MPDYKESSVSGTQWQRCNQVVIDNPIGGVPSVTMSEELVVQAGENRFVRTAEGLRFAFDPAETIPLLNPATGEPLGAAMTAQDVYVAIWSLYIKKATERDQAA